MAAPTNPVIRGDNTVIWGSNGVFNTGYIKSAKKSNTSDKVEVQDNTGYVVTTIYFNHKGECEFTMVVRGAIPEFNSGDLITVAGLVNCQVDNADVNWAQAGVVEMSIKATKYAKI
ncbi:hypothetical protein DB346_03000 [Verrucomicrobia bacterium LW23]|nr:hypothetical protein DB346_03655 [Verrucomicrobia bacterium LW23]PTY04417.1 hypothetical protein DB346_03000 [Verrucomicrobia bacterium LW23]